MIAEGVCFREQESVRFRERPSQHRPERVGRYLGDTTLAMAILDRLAMNAIRVDINGPSYRQHIAEQRAAKQPAAKGEIAAS